MAVMYHRTRGGASKVFLATPCYDKLGPGFAFSLAESARLLTDNGIGFELAIFSGDCHVDDARNRLVRDFLQGDCTDLVFLDADLGWQPEDLLRLIRHDRDVVAATYPYREGGEGFPVRLLGGESWADADGLLEAEGVPTGFLRIRRHVLQKLADSSITYSQKNGPRTALIFERQVHDGVRWGGDYTFCRKWRDIGGRIFVDPEMTIEHDQLWSGCLGHYLRVKAHGPMKAGVIEIQNKRDTAETYADMVKAWGNPNWSVDGDFLLAATELCRGKRVIECGAGITSIALSACANLTSLEADPEWSVRVERTIRGLGLSASVICAPMKNGWYDITVDGHYDVAVIDGPQRLSGRRNVLGRISADLYIFDDVNDESVLEAAKELGEPIILGKHRPFAIVRAMKRAA